MGRFRIWLLAGCLLWFTGYAHADVQKGRLLLFNNGNPTSIGIVSAKAEFEASVRANPSDQQANFFLAISRILALMDNTAAYVPGLPVDNLRELLDLFGVSASGRDIFHWTAEFTKDGTGKRTIPNGAPSGPAIQQFLTSVVIPEINSAVGNLSVLTSTFNTILTAAETGDNRSIEVDYGDVLILKSALYTAKAFILFLCSYDLDADPIRLVEAIKSKLSNLHSNLFDLYPQFLKLLPAGKPGMQAAEDEALAAIDQYFAASTFIRGETDSQLDDLVTIDPDELDEEAHLRAQLTEVKQSILSGRTAAFTNQTGTKVWYVNLNHLFGTSAIQPPNIRALIPYFDAEGNIPTGTFPDTTLDGILVECTSEAKLVEYSPLDLPIVFPIPDRTMAMDGYDSDWQQVPSIPKVYFSSHSRSQDIEYVKVAKDQNYFYWMVRHVTPLQSGRYYYFGLSGDAADGRFNVSVNLQSTGTYSIWVWPAQTSYTGTSADYRIGTYFLEGRIPRSLLKQSGRLGLNYSASNWTAGYNTYMSDSAILATALLPIAEAGADQIVFDAVTLDGKAIYPTKRIISWEWSLRHRTNSSFNRTASGQSPTISGLKPGFYDVILTVIDDSGKTYTDTKVLVATGASAGIYTQEQLNQAVATERAKWDASGDGKIGLEEAIRALQVTSGMRED